MIEDEERLIGKCKALSHVRVDSKDINMDCINVMLGADCIKITCNLLSELFDERRELIYNVTYIDDNK